MPLPDNFSPTEHLQDQIKRFANKSVARYFKDLGGENWDPPADLKSQPRASLRIACTHQEMDTINQTIARLFLYYNVIRRDELTDTPVYGIPIPEEQARVKFKPQVVLFFAQRPQEVTGNAAPATGRIAFRLKNEETNTLTESEVNALALQIKTRFGGATPYKWQKGKAALSYKEPGKYNFFVLCRTRSAGRDLIRDVMLMNNDTPDWKYASWHENEDANTAYDNTPGVQMILGKPIAKPRRRPLADVYFQSAVLHIWGLSRPIVLYTLSGRGSPAIRP